MRKGEAVFLVIVVVFVIITVAEIASGCEIYVRWAAPVLNEDGTQLDDLAGYKIYYGTSSGDYAYIVDTGNVIDYTLTDLPEMRYYINITAYDTSGNESGFTKEISRYACDKTRTCYQTADGTDNIVFCNCSLFIQ